MTDSRTLGQRVPKEGLFLMDGIEGLRSLPKHSVDMLLTDPPYGTTRNYWDVPLPLPELWEAVKWAVKPNGAVLFFAQCPFDKVLGASNLAMQMCIRDRMWAEAMEIYRSGRFKLAFSPTMQRYLKEQGQAYPGYIWYQDLDHDGVITTGLNTVDDPGDRKVIGNNAPRYRYNLSLIHI